MSTMKSYEGRKCDELYKIISARQLIAVMMHSDLMELFAFLSLDEFEKEQCEQCKEEFEEHLKLVKHYGDLHNKLLCTEINNNDRVNVFPQDWQKYTKFDVTTQARKKMVMESFNKWLDWEKETCEILSGVAYEFMHQGLMSDYDFVMKYVRDVTKEIKHVSKLVLSMKATDYDEVYIQDMQ